MTTYDQAGRVTQASTTIGASTTTHAYEYDTASRLKKQKLNGLVIATTTYSPDNASLDPGKLDQVTYPTGAGNTGNGTKGTITYDTLGRIASLAWATTTNAAITSDAVTRSLTGKVLTDTIDGAAAPGWSYTYDTVGRLVRATGSGQDYQYGYSAATCGTSPDAGKNTNRTQLSNNGTVIATYCYDPADRLTSSTATGYTGTITYDTHGNTTAIAANTYTYDYANRSTGITAPTQTAVTYTRDAFDRVVARTETNLATSISITQRYGYTGPGDSSALTLNVANSVLEHVLSLPGGVTYTTTGIWSYPNMGQLTLSWVMSEPRGGWGCGRRGRAGSW